VFTSVERTDRVPSGSNTADGMLSLYHCRCLIRYVKIISCTFGNKAGNGRIVAILRRVRLTVAAMEKQ